MAAADQLSGKIPATIITGFLGAGKTTLIRNLLQNAGGRRIALVINEFGDVGVDGELLKGCGEETCREEDIVELANGCICCTVADDFLPTIEKLLARTPRPDHIVIETSGLALPKPLVKAFTWPEIRTQVTVGGVVTLVDAAALSEGRFASDEEAVAKARLADEMLDHESPLKELFEDQLGCADLVVMNKADLLPAEDLARLEKEVRSQLRRGVQVLRVQKGVLPVDVLLGIDAAAEDDLAARPSHHDGDDDHDHDDFESFVVETGAITAPDRLAGHLSCVIGAHDILRLKGFAAVEGSPMRLAVQAVGQRIEQYFERDWRADETQVSRFVVIGLKGLDRPSIEQALKQVPVKASG